MKLRKLVLISLLLAAAVFLAGCAAQPKPAASPTTVPATDAPTEPTANPAAAVEGAVAAAGEAAEGAANAVGEATEDAAAVVGEAAETVSDGFKEALADAKARSQELLDAAKAAIDGKKPLLLTLAELSVFDGKEGRPAYVAVDGVIYDMTNSIPWKNGEHNGYQAGNDLTREIKEISPHGVKNLERVTEVGRLKVELTLEQLKEFDGKEGRPAYIAIEGIIYDVSAHPSWEGGAHKGVEAGQDVSEQFKGSPHEAAILSQAVEIGVLVQ